MNSNNVSSLA